MIYPRTERAANQAMYYTTRRFPRTLGEAFKGADYASSIETPRHHIIGFGGHMRPRKLPQCQYISNSLWARIVRALRRLWGAK